MITTALLVTEGCFASTLFGLVDALSCAGRAAARLGRDVAFQTQLVSCNGQDVDSTSDHTIAVDRSIEDAGAPDLVIVVPSIAPDATQEDVNRVMVPLDAAFDWLRHRLAQGSVLVSSCTGSFVLAEAGVLNGKRATTHWLAAQTFRDRYPDVDLQAQDMITDNGALVCGGGAASHVDLSLHLIRRFGGEGLASDCAHTLVVDPVRSLQSPYALMTYKTDHGDDLVSRAQDHIARSYGGPLAVQGLAEQLHVGERTLARRFKTATGWPIGLYIQSTRIDAARYKLTTTEMSLQSIVLDVGYEDYSSFARLFKNRTGLTMQSYRERFRSNDSAGI